MLVQDGLQRSRANTPTKIGLVCGDRRLSFEWIDDAANRLANALRAHGIKRGDRVCIYLPNTVEAVISIYAILKASATFVVINRSVRIEKLCYIISDCQATALITDGAFCTECTLSTLYSLCPDLRFAVVNSAISAAQTTGHQLLTFADIQRRFSPCPPPCHSLDLDLACLVYTSGSTGEPKGVMCDHSNVIFASDSIALYLSNSYNDVVLNVLPLSYSYGLYQLLTTFRSGGTLILEQSFAFPSSTLELIQKERITGWAGVPTIFAALLRMNLHGFDLSSLRYLTNAASALSADHIMKIRHLFPAVEFYSMYGLTETARALYMPPSQLDTRPGSVGKAIPGTEVWIEDTDGNRLGPGAVGELVVRGRHVMRGYWHAPDATSVRFKPGPIPGERVCHTGDLFRTDDDGYYYFVSRKDDIIKTRGEKVAPHEVETIICTLPGVFSAAVIGVPDPLLGQAIKAILVADTSCVTMASVIAHCRARLEDYMVPRYVEFRNELPVTSSGKLMRRGLVPCAESPV